MKYKSLVLSLFFVAILWQNAEGAQLAFRSVSVEGKKIELGGGEVPFFLDVNPNSGLLGSEYGVSLEVQNIGDKISLKDVAVRVYSGSFTQSVPSNLSMLQIDASEVGLLLIQKCVSKKIERILVCFR